MGFGSSFSLFMHCSTSVTQAHSRPAALQSEPLRKVMRMHAAVSCGSITRLARFRRHFHFRCRRWRAAWRKRPKGAIEWQRSFIDALDKSDERAFHGFCMVGERIVVHTILEVSCLLQLLAEMDLNLFSNFLFNILEGFHIIFHLFIYFIFNYVLESTSLMSTNIIMIDVELYHLYKI